MDRSVVAVNGPDWKFISGTNGKYQVSRSGEVASLKSWGWSKLGRRTSKGGYHHIRIRRNGGISDLKVHQLVLEHFVGPRPEGMVACHRNDNKDDNSVENLYWGTMSDNAIDRVNNGGHDKANASKCLRGHSFSGANLYISPGGGGRVCRSCRAARKRHYGGHIRESEIGSVADHYYRERYGLTESGVE